MEHSTDKSSEIYQKFRLFPWATECKFIQIGWTFKSKFYICLRFNKTQMDKIPRLLMKCVAT